MIAAVDHGMKMLNAEKFGCCFTLCSEHTFTTNFSVLLFIIDCFHKCALIVVCFVVCYFLPNFTWSDCALCVQQRCDWNSRTCANNFCCWHCSVYQAPGHVGSQWYWEGFEDSSWFCQNFCRFL